MKSLYDLLHELVDRSGMRQEDKADHHAAINDAEDQGLLGKGGQPSEEPTSDAETSPDTAGSTSTVTEEDPAPIS